VWSQLDNSFQLLTVVQNSILNTDALARFSADFAQQSSERDRLKNNYTLESLDVENHVMFDALYTKAGQFVACSGIYRRPAWPAGAYRLLNRTFFGPSFRTSGVFRFYASDHILPSQLERCTAKLSFKFVSRQGPFAANFLKTLQQRPLFANNYRLSEAFIQVVPDVYDAFSFQKILYTKDPSDSFYLFNSVSKLDKTIEKSQCRTISL